MPFYDTLPSFELEAKSSLRSSRGTALDNARDAFPFSNNLTGNGRLLSWVTTRSMLFTLFPTRIRQTTQGTQRHLPSASRWWEMDVWGRLYVKLFAPGEGAGDFWFGGGKSRALGGFSDGLPIPRLATAIHRPEARRGKINTWIQAFLCWMRSIALILPSTRPFTSQHVPKTSSSHLLQITHKPEVYIFSLSTFQRLLPSPNLPHGTETPTRMVYIQGVSLWAGRSHVAPPS